MKYIGLCHLAWSNASAGAIAIEHDEHDEAWRSQKFEREKMQICAAAIDDWQCHSDAGIHDADFAELADALVTARNCHECSAGDRYLCPRDGSEPCETEKRVSGLNLN